MTLAPYYRLYELPWSPTEDVERRFRVTLRNAIIVFAIIVAVLLLVPVTERPRSTPADIPERIVKMLIEKKIPPPPPPPKEEEKPKVEDKKPVEKEKPKEDPNKKAKQEMKAFDAFKDLRDPSLDKIKDNNLTKNVEETRSERFMVSSATGKSSGGINNASLSRGYGGRTGDLKAGDTTKVSSGLGSGDGRPQVTRTSGSGKGARSREEVELTFDKNKGQIYQIYSRALRDNPDLKGKVVFEITISPTGDVANCRVLSSELNDPELERKLIARIKLFHFEARDVESLTLTKPIDFFPAG